MLVQVGELFFFFSLCYFWLATSSLWFTFGSAELLKILSAWRDRIRSYILLVTMGNRVISVSAPELCMLTNSSRKSQSSATYYTPCILSFCSSCSLICSALSLDSCFYSLSLFQYFIFSYKALRTYVWRGAIQIKL